MTEANSETTQAGSTAGASSTKSKNHVNRLSNHEEIDVLTNMKRKILAECITSSFFKSVINFRRLSLLTVHTVGKGMILHRANGLLEDLPDLNVSRSLSVVPVEGSSSLLKSLFTSALEDVMTQLWILDRCNNGLTFIKTISDIDYLKTIKYNVYDASEVKDELDLIDVKNLNCTIYKIKKLNADRTCVNKVMVETYLSLAQSFTFNPLVSYITSVQELDRYRTNLVEEETKNKMLRKELSRQLRQQRNHIKTVLYDTEAIIDKLRTEVEDSVLYSEVSGRYIDNWQEARTEQHTQMIFNIENKPSTTIEYYKQRIDHELRVHTEVETLVTISITETLTKTEEWMTKFDKDMEKIDLKIQIMKNNYQDTRDTNKRHEEMLARHDMKIKQWIQFKTERDKAQRYHKKMMDSAIIVQSWWRGLLVRLCLGPYKVKKHRQGKKKA